MAPLPTGRESHMQMLVLSPFPMDTQGCMSYSEPYGHIWEVSLAEW